MHEKNRFGWAVMVAWAILSAPLCSASAQPAPGIAEAAQADASPKTMQELIDLEALRRLKARYFFYWDTDDKAGWLSLFAPDGSFQFENDVSTAGQPGHPTEKFSGKALARLADGMPDVQTTHLGHSELLQIISPTEARGIWAMEDIVDNARANRSYHGYGHYYETYRKIDGEWKISTSYLERSRLIITQR